MIHGLRVPMNLTLSLICIVYLVTLCTYTLPSFKVHLSFPSVPSYHSRTCTLHHLVKVSPTGLSENPFRLRWTPSTHVTTSVQTSMSQGPSTLSEYFRRLPRTDRTNSLSFLGLPDLIKILIIHEPFFYSSFIV